MSDNIEVFESADILASRFAAEVLKLVKKSSLIKIPCNIMLSGGSTPALLFTKLAEMSDKNTDFGFVHFFWGDERCVPFNDPESNYGMAKALFFDKISIPDANIHPMYTKSDIGAEVRRNEKLLAELPDFDLVMLGMGDDGHTASIFPDNMAMFDCVTYCSSAIHPVSGQRRITVTPRFLKEKTQSIVFLVTGANKANILSKVMSGSPDAISIYPTAKLRSTCNNIRWLLDESASSAL